MYKSEAVDHFGNALTLAKALKITSGAISLWGEIIPEKQALKLDRLTKGSLKYDPSLYEKIDDGNAYVDS
ncbi:Regulatory protein cro [Vibrio nigripulchritudo SFn27]|uniref:Regulatory protein cro n=1 Tax=Vibrio nigripulchritudo TaxID=28173 RepID=U4KBJ7_9VIBR|nr:Cro/CI family transcriptional regulator [Vibrio nigripulchritudo]CCN38196.1 Regulatory protein cro [Vibrio nigripulchritudo AM115]CCN42674.1 Regulatory protein cro [Vibrio nigripulchritudo FTn2]CCN79070.1 Regulatory protein cro [Vibrio nigripulchritudo SO65]CCN84352.1 Regulatory protein cro [Vibrio nigripulchritudo BLFn1]CCN87141.1 Regulatory protein cro [Vibrio nigripulchritudo SFn27]